jgi:hypothetical protein
MPLGAAIAVGGLVASGVRKLAKKNKGIHGKVRNINDRFMSQKPVGYLTNEDYAFSERGRARGARSIGALHKQRTSEAINRITARGLAYSPAAEYLQKQGTQDEAAALTDLEHSTQDRLYGLRLDREGFERQRLMTAWGSELGAVQSDFAGKQAQDASFWNSWLPVMEDAASYFTGLGNTATSAAGSGPGSDAFTRGYYQDYTPETPQFR